MTDDVIATQHLRNVYPTARLPNFGAFAKPLRILKQQEMTRKIIWGRWMTSYYVIVTWILLCNIWPSITKMSIKVISLILIAFLARNCYKYIINYKSVDFDNNYITPMFMRKVGVGKKIVSKNFLTRKIFVSKNFWLEKFLTRKILDSKNFGLEKFLTRKNPPTPYFRMPEENGKEKLMCFPSGNILL